MEEVSINCGGDAHILISVSLVFQGIVLGLNILACSVPAAYWYHKAVYLGERVYTRSTTAFGLLSVIDLGLFNLPLNSHIC